MKSFASIHKETLDQRERQRIFLQRLEEASHFSVVQKRCLPQDGYLIGVASGWAYRDLQVLDRLSRTKALSYERPWFVFEVMMYEDVDDLHRDFPGISDPTHTPFFIEIEDGRLIEQLSGYPAMQRLDVLVGE